MKIFDRFLDSRQDAGHGPWQDADGGWVDAKPYVGHWHPGLFEGYDHSVWMYFEFPEDVRLEWLADADQAIENQHFFVDFCQEISKMLGEEGSAKKDVRREFHMVATQHPAGPIKPYEGCTPEHADYLSRMSSQYSKPSWRGFIGVRLIPSDVFHETYGFMARVRRFVDALRNPGDVRWSLLKQDLDDIPALMERQGFRGLDFTKDVEALERLTAWYGVPDSQFDLPVQLQTQRVQEPVHGRSVVLPRRFGEMSFYALTPEDGVDVRDPQSNAARWGEALYRPDADVGVVSIRGQVRAISSSDNLLDLRAIKSAKGGGGDHIADLINASRSLVTEDRLPVLDNVEIIVGASLARREVSEQPIERAARDRGMRASVLVNRQAIALLSTLPTYPRHVSRVPKGNGKRPRLTNVMLPGVLAFSGIFRANKPSATRGIILGLGDVGNQYPEILMDPDGASKNNKSPTMLISGRSGGGKTVQLTQMTAQASYMGLPVVFLNPKSTGTLKPYFDHIGGQTISMSMTYLEENPGLLDPVFFLQDRNSVAALLSDAIVTAMRMAEDGGSAGSQRRTALTAEVRERALNPDNLTSHHILFGNKDRGTLPISDQDVLNFVTNKMRSAPFWRALISVNSQSALTRTLRESKALLVEWGSGLELPSADTERHSDAQVDAVLSVTTVFRYAAERIEGTGGLLIIDESWILRHSRDARDLLERAGREWRQANIMLVLGTQRIRDWAVSGGQAADLTSFISRFLLMAITENDEEEMQAFFKLSGLEDTPRHRRYMVNAAAERTPGGKTSIAKGYLVDSVHGWRGGILCGPWPAEELNIGRTDIEAQRARASMGDGRQHIDDLNPGTEDDEGASW